MPSGTESAKQKFAEAVDKTKNSVGGTHQNIGSLRNIRRVPSASPARSQRASLSARQNELMFLLTVFGCVDAKGPPIKIAQPSTNDASISNKFVNPGRTAHPHPDTVESQQQSGGSNHTSFFKGSVS